MLEQIFEKASAASRKLAQTSGETRINALKSIASALLENAETIIDANRKDCDAARQGGMSESMLDRLMIDKKRLESISSDVIKVAELDEPIGRVLDEYTAASGIAIKKISVPFGVIGVIYESRPNVTVDVAVLCLKTANVCLLKGGSEAANTNAALESVMRSAIEKYVDKACITLLLSTRDAAAELISAKGKVDLIVPRGSRGLIDYVVTNSAVPVIETGAGVCHIYISADADLDMAMSVLINAKTSRPSVCNAVESLLVDSEIAQTVLPRVAQSLKAAGVILRGDQTAARYIPVEKLTERGYSAEYDDLQLSIKVVSGIDEAIEHINTFGTHHSDCIITRSAEKGAHFQRAVDSACVYVNASTRFTDGGCFGFGAELGISTQKLHARGPMGLKEMTSYKYIINGDGQIR